jgi:orotate phosphoribosyltransferase
MDRGALVELLIRYGVLKFGDFTLKSGRRSPYFFDLGAIADGAGLAVLGEAYAAAYAESFLAEGIQADVVFGPAYKGIPVAVAMAVALARDHGTSIGVAFNRKEVKAHGEGGRLVGRALAGAKVLIVDDVMTAGTAVGESLEILREAGATVAGVLVALDRRERLEGGRTAVERIEAEIGAPARAILRLEDVIEFLDRPGGDADSLARIRAYQRENCSVRP